MKTTNVCLTLALISTAACGGYSSPSGPTTQQQGNTPPAAGQINVTNNAFTPASKTVTVGTTVEWVWNTCTGDPYGGTQNCVSHNVTFDDGSPSSASLSQGSFSKTFNAAGTFNYHCTLHTMTGSIIVQ